MRLKEKKSIAKERIIVNKMLTETRNHFMLDENIRYLKKFRFGFRSIQMFVLLFLGTLDRTSRDHASESEIRLSDAIDFSEELANELLEEIKGDG